MNPAKPAARQPSRRTEAVERRPKPPGFTLVEMVMALAVMAVLGAIATPSLSALLARQRLQAAAHELQADIAQAKLESSQRGQPVQLRFQTGTSWCYALSVGPEVDCTTLKPNATASLANGLIKVVRGSEHAGVTLLAAQTMTIDAVRSNALLSAAGPGWARFASRDGQQLQVRLGPQSRASLCAPGAPLDRIAACPLSTPTSAITAESPD